MALVTAWPHRMRNLGHWSSWGTEKRNLSIPAAFLPPPFFPGQCKSTVMWSTLCLWNLLFIQFMTAVCCASWGHLAWLWAESPQGIPVRLLHGSCHPPSDAYAHKKMSTVPLYPAQRSNSLRKVKEEIPDIVASHLAILGNWICVFTWPFICYLDHPQILRCC